MDWCFLLILCVISTFYRANSLERSNLQSTGIKTSSARIQQKKSIQSTYIECVDIHKQPAFDHPLLSHHEIQMEPTFSTKQNNGNFTELFKFSTWEKKGCPSGFVPIQKIRNAKSLIHPLTDDRPGYHFATYIRKLAPDETYFHGAEAIFTVQRLQIADDQFSGAVIAIQNGPDNLIMVGWMVNPQLYGDSGTYLTAFWTGGGSTTGCYNVQCPGFVQTHEQIHLGERFKNLSVYGGDQFGAKFNVFQDQASGNWWLTVDENNKIGYWPKEIFNDLAKGSNQVGYGGIVHSPAGHPGPPMGNGQWASGDSATSSLVGRMQVVNDNYVLASVIRDRMLEFLDSPYCYGLRYWGYGQDMKQAFTFGGPGKDDCGT